MTNLKTEIRTKFRRDLRNNIDKDTIPAELYGKEVGNKHLSVQRSEFNKVLLETGESGVVILDIDGEKITVIIRDVQKTPLSEINHIDFYAVKKGVKIKTEVSLNFIGEAPAVKEKSGILVKSLNVLEVEAIPSELPNSIDVDLSKLEDIHDSIHIKDINVSSGIKIFESPDTVIASISAPSVAEEQEEETEDVSETTDDVKDDSKDKNEKQTKNESEK